MVKTFTIDRSLENVVAIVTGASSGIGYTAARSLYKAGAHVILACRNEAKTNAAIARMKEEVGADTKGQVEFMKLDTSDLTSVRNFVDSFLAKRVPLHLLINNAGIASVQEGNDVSAQGFEMIFATNYLGHFLLTKLLESKLKETAKQLKTTPPNGSFPLSSVRVVNVSSKAHSFVKAIPFEELRNPPKQKPSVTNSTRLYGISKCCQILYTQHLATQWKEDDNIQVFSVHPGVVATDVWRGLPGFLQTLMKLFMISEEKGSYTTLYCALSPDVKQLSGEYFDDCQKGKRTQLSQDPDLAKQLWEKSEQWTQQQ